ncbi:hypothetical protein pb186bvf_009333 [Paramecium bursaria]
MIEPMVELNDKLMGSFKMSKVFKDHQKDINAIDFSQDGQYLVSCDDQVLNIYDVQNGKKVRTLYNKIKEIDLVKFTHHISAVLCATKKEPYEILYWSLHENAIIKKFVGHTDLILWLDLSPVSDEFISCSRDGSLRLYNLNSQSQFCDAMLDLSSKRTFCIGAFDPTGKVFGIAFLEEYFGIHNNWIYLYNLQEFDKGSFLSKKLNCSQIRILKFSRNNKMILNATTEGTIFILDAYSLNNIHELSDYSNEGSYIEASFTPDSQYVLSGSETGTIFIWEMRNGTLVAKLDGHQKRSRVVKFSPTFCLFASGCRNLVFWTPEYIPDQQKRLMSY